MTIEFPTESNHFKARFNPWIGIISIGVGLVLFLLALRTILLSSTFSFRIFIGVLLIVVGLLYFKRPYFAIAPNRLTVYNAFGQIVKRYPFANFNNIEIDSSKVYIRAAEANSPNTFPFEARELVKIRPWMTKSSDWKILKQIART